MIIDQLNVRDERMPVVRDFDDDSGLRPGEKRIITDPFLDRSPQALLVRTAFSARTSDIDEVRRDACARADRDEHRHGKRAKRRE